MQEYIATFFSHFGALRFHRLCLSRHWEARLAPVPRSLSSSCGTCVLFSTDAEAEARALLTPELERLVRADACYTTLYQAQE